MRTKMHDIIITASMLTGYPKEEKKQRQKKTDVYLDQISTAKKERKKERQKKKELKQLTQTTNKRNNLHT